MEQWFHLLWTRNLIETQHQIFGEESNRSTTSLSPALLSQWGSHCCRRWYLHCMWRLSCIGNYVQPSFKSSWTETQGWHTADETRYQTCCWVCPYLQKKICDQVLPLLESLFETQSYNKMVAFANWLRHVLAKYMGFPRESSNLSGDENFFFGKFPHYYKE